MIILVTGATGTVGGLVLEQLVENATEHGHQLRALVRNPAAFDAPTGVEVVQGDVTDPDDVHAALDGVQRAFLNMGEDNGATFAQVAGKAELEHVVLLSSFSTVVELPLGDANIVTARHRAGEQALTDAGVPATFLRAAGFDYNILMWASEAKDGVVRAPYLDVKLPVVDPADIAASAVAVLLDPSPAGGAYSITGPEPLSVRDQTDIVARVLGQSLALEAVPEADAKAAAFPEGTPDFVTTSVFGTFGPEATALPVSRDVEALTGRPARTFEQWATEHVGAFR